MLLAIINNNAVNFPIQICVTAGFHFSWENCQAVPNHLESVCEDSVFSTSSSTFVIVLLKKFSHPSGCKVIP